MARQLSMKLYLKHLKKQYVGASRKTKSRLLTELFRLGGYHRKYAIELLSGRTPKVNYGRRKRDKKKTYRIRNAWVAQILGLCLKNISQLALSNRAKHAPIFRSRHCSALRKELDG